MKTVKLTILLIVIISSSAFSQSIRLFNVDASDFPLMRAHFYAFDEEGNQQRPSISELGITENGEERNIINVSCPPGQPPIALSVVLLVDVTIYNNIDNAKSVLNSWVDQLELGKNEVALVSYEWNSYINQDFTTDRNLLQSAINNLRTLGGKEDHTGALIRPVTGGISVAEQGKFRKVILLLSSCTHFSSDKITTIIQRAKQSNVMLNFAIFDKYDWTPELTMQMSLETGGYLVNKIPYNDLETAKNAFKKIYQHSQGGDHCTIEWESGTICKSELQNIELHWDSVTAISFYTPSNSGLTKLEYEPNILRFEELELGVWQSQTVRVTAKYGKFFVTDIEISNSSYEITPKSFVLNPGESIDLTVSYLPLDWGYTFCRFNLINETCPSGYSVTGGISGMQATERTIKLLHPNGGEVFVAGSDTIITWEGVPEDEPVKIEYRTSDETEWVTIADSATGLSHPFRIPDIISDTYLARISSAIQYIRTCEGGEVQIGNQIWMQCNLDVTHYRNRDEIFHAKTEEEWLEANENGIGAWCYYGNAPKNGFQYGKLYNFYAVNDDRGLAPEGWRVPSNEDWMELEMALGMTEFQAGTRQWRGSPVGAKLAGGYDFWREGLLRDDSNFNSSGFSGLPGGYRDTDGNFLNVEEYTYWWSISGSSTSATIRGLYYYYTYVHRTNFSNRYGLSVRCLKE